MARRLLLFSLGRTDGDSINYERVTGTSSVTLYPTRSSMIWLLVGCSIFVATGICMGTTGEVLGYVFGAFFNEASPSAASFVSRGAQETHEQL